MKICPRCNQSYSVSRGVTDYIHDCNSGDTVLDNEDILVIGTWVDYTGSATVNGKAVPLQGRANDLEGTEAGNRGGYFGGVTERGNNAQTHRTRKHLEYIDLKMEKDDGNQ